MPFLKRCPPFAVLVILGAVTVGTGVPEARAIPWSPWSSDLDGDSDVDLTDFVVFGMCFNGPNRAYPGLTYCPQADFNSDADVNLADFGVFAACFNGPNRPPAYPSCDLADIDTDGDVDLTDFGVFASCFNGQNRPPACE